MNIKESVEEYLDSRDWRVKSNANQGYSLGGLVQHLSGKAQANYWLDEVYPEKAANLHRAGAIHIHDLGMLSTYCVGHSLPTLLATGFTGVDGKVASRPPKHLSSAIGQMVNYLGTLQNESAGAQAFSSFDTLLAPYVWIDGLGYAEVKQEIQEFVYAMNIGSRFGAQPVFSNLTFDWTCPADLEGKYPAIAGEELAVTYGELTSEMGMINRAFLEVMLEGDAKGRAHTFPIPTYNITPEFDWDTQNAELLLELTAKYGLPYFQNFVNSDLNPGDVRSMCPLHPDTLVPVRGPSGISVSTLQNIYLLQEAGTQYEVLVDGEWVPAIATKHASKTFYEVRTANGASVIMDSRHEQLARREEDRPEELLIAEELQARMLLPFNKRPLCEEDRNNSLAGYAIGAFLAYGKAEDGRLEYSPSTDGMLDKLKAFYEGLAFGVDTISQAGRVKLIVSGGDNEAVKWMDQFVSGQKLTRRVWNLGTVFMQGVLGGLTDPSQKKILCPNANRVNDVQALCTFCGLDYVANRHDKGAIITVGGLKEEKLEEYQWVPITSIVRINAAPGEDHTCYCFAVPTDDHLFTLASGLVTHNCRLQLDLGELTKRGGGLFGANDQTGSIGVVTLNMARIGYMHRWETLRWETPSGILRDVDDLLYAARDVLEAKRAKITEWMSHGLYPYTKAYVGSWRNFFSTVGVNGVNEMILNFRGDGKGIESPEGKQLAVVVLKHIRKRLVEFQEETGNLYNLEATPAEGCTTRFAREDKRRLPGIIQAGTEEAPYYTNSTQLPVDYTDDPFVELDHQEELQRMYTGGTVVHLYMSEKLPDTSTTKKLIQRALTNYRIPYLTITPTFSVCSDHGYLTGEQAACPTCGRETEVWTRVMGYYRPVSSFNAGKTSEHNDRVHYQMPA